MLLCGQQLLTVFVLHVLRRYNAGGCHYSVFGLPAVQVRQQLLLLICFAICAVRASCFLRMYVLETVLVHGPQRV